MMDTQTRFVTLEDFGPVRRLTLNRPQQRNALSLAMLDALRIEIDAAYTDPNINVIVLAANGPAFCAGHDLKELTAARSAADGGTETFAETFAVCSAVMMAIAEGAKPVIAEVQAIATAAGCQLVASCDLAVASETARFATPGVNIGLFCSTPAVALTRAVPAKAAMEMLLTGEAVDAQTALRIGLINRIAPPEALTETTMALAQVIASKPADVVALGKRTLRAQQGLPLPEAYQRAQTTMTCNMAMPSAVAGIAGFLAPKRK